MNPKSKLQQQEQTELQAEVQSQSASPGKTFENVEDLLRHDAAQTNPPAQIQARLAESIENEPAPGGNGSCDRVSLILCFHFRP